MTLPFDGVFEVGLTDGAVIKEYGGTWAVLPSHCARMMLEFKHTDTHMSLDLCQTRISEKGDSAPCNCMPGWWTVHEMYTTSQNVWTHTEMTFLTSSSDLKYSVDNVNIKNDLLNYLIIL